MNALPEKNETTADKVLLLSIRGVAPDTMASCRSIAQTLKTFQLEPYALAVIPRLMESVPAKDRSEFVAWLREEQECGNEIVLHGFDGQREVRAHRQGGWSSHPLETWDPDSLYFEMLDLRARVERDWERLRSADLDVASFIAPEWIVGREFHQVIKDMGFRYSESGSRVRLLKRNLSYSSPCISYSRHTATLARRFWMPAYHRLAAGARILRVAIHADYETYPAATEQIFGHLWAAKKNRTLTTPQVLASGFGLSAGLLLRHPAPPYAPFLNARHCP